MRKALQMIQEQRLKLNLNQKQTSEKAGLHNNMVSKIENGYNVHNDKTLKMLANTLELNADTLIRAADKERKEIHDRRKIGPGWDKYK